MKYLLIGHSCGADVIEAVVNLTIRIKPATEVCAPEDKYVVDNFVYYRPDVSDHMEESGEQLEEGDISDLHCLRSRGVRSNGITSSSDRVAGITIQADTIEGFNREHRTFIDSIKILDADGNDIMRHDLLPKFTV